MERKKRIVNLAANGAIVIINGEERDTYCAPYGTEIEWSVSKDGYESQSGAFILTEDKTLEITLIAIPTQPLVLTINNADGMQTPIVGRYSDDTEYFGSYTPYILGSVGGSMDVEINGTLYEDVVPNIDDTFELPGLISGDNILKFYPKDNAKFVFNYAGYADSTLPTANIVSIDQWGDSRFTNLYYTFAYSNKFKSIAAPTNAKTFADLKDAFALFYYCRSLESLPDGLFADAKNLADASYLCAYTSFATLPSSLFSKEAVVDMDLSYAFAYSSIVEIPSGFLKDTKISTLSRTFYNCSLLEKIGDNAFENCAGVTTAEYAFYNCTSLKSVPDSLFEGFDVCKTFAQCFRNNGSAASGTSLVSVGSRVFAGCKAATSFRSCFYDCYKLETIGDGLFDGCESATDFGYCFRHCESLKAIPADTFAGCYAIEDLSYCFRYYAGESIPAELFKDRTALTTVSYAFANADNLKEIGASLFEGCISLTTSTYCFYYADKLETVGSNIFKGCSALTSVGYTFYLSSSTEEAPVTFGDSVFEGTAFSPQGTLATCPIYAYYIILGNRTFANNTGTSMYGALWYVIDVLSIGDETFAGCENVTDFGLALGFYLQVSEIAANTFKGCKSATSIAQIFNGWTKLKEIPAGIFDDMPALGDVQYFADMKETYGEAQQTSDLTKIPINLFANCKNILRFDGALRASNYNAPLEGESPYDLVEIDGVETKVHWYERANYPNIFAAPTSYSDCYAGQTNLEDYDQIPNGWK